MRVRVLSTCFGLFAVACSSGFCEISGRDGSQQQSMSRKYDFKKEQTSIRIFTYETVFVIEFLLVYN